MNECVSGFRASFAQVLCVLAPNMCSLLLG